MHVCVLSHFVWVQLSATLWTVALQAPLSMGFSRQEYWSGLHALLQGIFPTHGSNQHFLHVLFWQAGSLLLVPSGKPTLTKVKMQSEEVGQSYPTLCDPMDCSLPGKSTGMGCRFLLQGIFLTLVLNPGLPHCRQTLYHLSHQGSWSYLPKGSSNKCNSTCCHNDEAEADVFWAGFLTAFHPSHLRQCWRNNDTVV